MKSRKQTHQGYLEIIKQAEKDNEVQAAKRTFCQHDLFFLLVYVLHRQDIDRDWLFDRCREVQHDPNGYLDLWARDHYKSSIITYGLTIQDILNNPEITVGIFSFIRPIAKSFMRQIKTDFESNEELKELFPDIFWSNPRKEAPKWSEDDGIVCKRKSNPKEATIEAWGLVDGMPTGRHYKLRVYDDIITEKSVTTPEMINKVTTAWELSQNLGQEGGEQRIIGTRYHFADTYHVMMERGSVIPREYPAFSCQMLLDPVAEEMQELKPKWLQYWPAIHYTNMNLYLFCDPAGEKKKTNDYTVFTVWGLGPDNNYYVIEWIRDRMNLTERANVLFTLQRRYNPDRVIYEKYGMQSDIEHYQDRMNRENYRFRIEEIGGQVNKEDRIRKLIPLFEQGRIYIPETCSVHDDMLDCMARIVDTRTDRPDLLDDFMGLDFQNLKDRNVLAMKDFERRQQTNEYSVLTDGMR
jgi:predicted phage terminase large subunit-like protein